MAAEWHAEWDPIQPANTMGALWCESGPWAGITDSTAHWLATGHWAPRTNWSRREWREQDDWVGALVTFRSLWTCVEVKTPTRFCANTQINASFMVRCTHTLGKRFLYSQTGRLVAELSCTLRDSKLAQWNRFSAWVCVFSVVSQHYDAAASH